MELYNLTLVFSIVLVGTSTAQEAPSLLNDISLDLDSGSDQIWGEDVLLKLAGSFETCRNTAKDHDDGHQPISSVTTVTVKRLAEWNITVNSKLINLNSRFIEEFTPYAFSVCEFLLDLNVSNNQISRLENSTFKCLFRLRTLDLSNNQIETIDSGAFEDLVNMYTLYLESNRLTKLSKELFLGLENLNGLNLAKNDINTISGDTFAALKKLSWLSLADNQLMLIDQTAFSAMASLQILNLAVNQLFYINSNMFKGLTGLKSLILASNEISVIDAGAFQQTTQLTYLDLNENRLETFKEELLNNVCLTSLNLDHNAIADKVFMYVNEQACLVIERLEVSSDNNKFKFNGHLNKNVLKLWETAEGQSNIELDLEYRGIKSIEQNSTFLQFRHLNSLNMYKNYISVLLNNTFAYLDHLTQLNLQGNQLYKIEPQAFKGLTELQVLDLSFNKLYSIDGELFKQLTKLSKLYLNNNKLISIDSIMFQDLLNLQYLDLSSNPLLSIQNANILSKPLCLAELKMNDVSKKLITQIDYAINANGNNQQCQMVIIGLPTEKKPEVKDFSKSLPLNYRIKAERMDVISTKDVETVVKSKIEKAKALIQAAIKANGDDSSGTDLKVTFNLNINLDELI